MSSSSPTSSVPPLPAELILHILHLAYPPHAEDDYTGRSRDVLQCCLVSKQWKELAEPVLWHSITVTSPAQVDQLAQSPPEKRSLSCILRFSSHTCLTGSRLADLEAFQNLRSFATTTYVNLENGALPRLERLRITWFPTVDVDALLDSSRTPALRHLKVEYLDPMSEPNRLVELLDILEIDPCVTERPNIVFQRAFGHVLINRCKDEGVEVRWYRPSKEEWREVGCREFREYVEERKRREEGQR
ncbi:hypothetical protein JCM8097_005699 [Rhodosporidiobolus ruineniae]